MTGRSHVLDASAILAMVHREPGWRAVADALASGAISAVNWAEVSQKVVALGEDAGDLRHDMEELGLAVEPFDVDDAEATAGLWPVTRALGLSLGDRACLALARRLGVPAVTADRSWASLDPAAGITVSVIRS